MPRRKEVEISDSSVLHFSIGKSELQQKQKGEEYFGRILKILENPQDMNKYGPEFDRV